MNPLSKFNLLVMLVAFACAMIFVGVLCFGCQSARWCEDDPRLTPTPGPVKVIDRVEIKIGK